jgi:hypothetical protein
MANEQQNPLPGKQGPELSFQGISPSLRAADEDQNRKDEKDYAESDVAEVYKQENFHSWGQVVQWLEKNGANQWHLTPGEAIHMVHDFKSLEQDNVPFTPDPKKAYMEAKEHRPHPNQQEIKKLEHE